MQIRVGNFEYTEVWDGVFYKKLSNYPHITDWEMRTIIEFTDYEKRYGRDCEIVCEDALLRRKICEGLENKARYVTAARPGLLRECTACPYRKGCETAYVCHTASAENAVKILQCGKLLSAVRARGLTAEELAKEKRNAAKDPPDYFDYVMFSWGNCQAGDRLVMERKLGRFPDEKDLSTGFQPGIRFYFKYEELANHPRRVFDGVLPMRVKDEVILADLVYRIIIPTDEKGAIDGKIPCELRDRVLYVENDCKDIWDWSEKVYRIIEKE